jgi:hypothetical protein
LLERDANRLLVAGILLLLVAGVILAAGTHTGPARENAQIRTAYCPFPCTNTSQSVPYYTTAQFWGGIGDSLIVGGIIGLLLGLTVYKHPLLIVGSVGLLVAGIVIAVVI